MKLDIKKTGLGIVVAVLLVSVLAKLSGFALSDFAKVSPFYAASAVLFSMLTLTLRAANYRAIANQKVAAPLRSWMEVSLRHQFLFAAIPSGLGDIGFPVLAQKYVGLNIKQGAGTIALARLRDLCILPALGCLGLALLGFAPVLAVFAAVVLSHVGLFLEQVISSTAGMFRKLGGNAPKSMIPSQNSWRLQLSRFVLTLCSWMSAAFALWCAYASAGFVLAPAASFVMLAGLNAIGLIAITVGGLGFAEAGSTGVLTFLGVPFDHAAQVSLIARPILLLAVLIACWLWWIIVRVKKINDIR